MQQILVELGNGKRFTIDYTPSLERVVAAHNALPAGSVPTEAQVKAYVIEAIRTAIQKAETGQS